eukprot:GHUV01052001.1.p1 GENE.GHUV01052001.1~~GHUV01052001.1.p1  ORF type:complete len:117 (-),score=24.95 GHUV01052001.1:556-906(-)
MSASQLTEKSQWTVPPETHGYPQVTHMSRSSSETLKQCTVITCTAVSSGVMSSPALLLTPSINRTKSYSLKRVSCLMAVCSSMGYRSWVSSLYLLKASARSASPLGLQYGTKSGAR